MSDRNVLVTGAAGEIGSFLVEELSREGWSVFGMDVRTPAKFAGKTFLECDLSNAVAAETAIEKLHAEMDGFDAVVNCAGLIASAPLLSFVDGKLAHHEPGLWDRVVSSCLSSAFYVTAITAKRMVETSRRGVIVNVSSVCSRGNAGQAAYSAAKAGMNAMTVTLAKELGPLGVRVVAIAPGYIDTTSTRENVAAPKLKEIRNSVPLRRLGRLEEVGSAVQFLLSNEYMNGKVLELDGGLVL